MLNYTCANCNKELRCEKNGIYLIHFNNNDRKKGIDAVRMGDLYRCENCDCRVVIGLSGSQMLGIDLTDSWAKKILESGNFVEVKR